MVLYPLAGIRSHICLHTPMGLWADISGWARRSAKTVSSVLSKFRRPDLLRPFRHPHKLFVLPGEPLSSCSSLSIVRGGRLSPQACRRICGGSEVFACVRWISGRAAASDHPRDGFGDGGCSRACFGTGARSRRRAALSRSRHGAHGQGPFGIPVQVRALVIIVPW